MNETAATPTVETYDDGDTLGGRIFHARDLAELTVEEAASRIGVTAETLAEWESDRSEPRANKIMILAGVLGVSPAWLISGVGDAPQPPGLAMAIGEMSGEITRLKELALQLTASAENLESRLSELNKATNE